MSKLARIVAKSLRQESGKWAVSWNVFYYMEGTTKTIWLRREGGAMGIPPKITIDSLGLSVLSFDFFDRIRVASAMRDCEKIQRKARMNRSERAYIEKLVNEK